MTRSVGDIMANLKAKYAIFAYNYDVRANLVDIIDDVYELLLELRERDSRLATEQAQWLIVVSKGWDVNPMYQEAWEHWQRVRHLFEAI